MGCLGEYGVTEYYSSHLEDGNEYEDFISYTLLKKYGIFVGVFGSRKYQNKIGESISGIEIKHDNKLAETRNVYIEIAEKSRATNRFWVPSGIYRHDNTYLYLIGDYDEAFLFSKNQLRLIYEDKKYCKKHHIIDRYKPTSLGFTYPVEEAMKGYVIKHFVFNKEKVYGDML